MFCTCSPSYSRGWEDCWGHFWSKVRNSRKNFSTTDHVHVPCIVIQGKLGRYCLRTWLLLTRKVCRFWWVGSCLQSLILGISQNILAHLLSDISNYFKRDKPFQSTVSRHKNKRSQNIQYYLQEIVLSILNQLSVVDIWLCLRKNLFVQEEEPLDLRCLRVKVWDISYQLSTEDGKERPSIYLVSTE